MSDHIKTTTAADMISAAVRGDVSHKFAQVGAAGSVIFGLSLNEWGVVIGILVAVGGLGMQWYYRRKEYKLKALYYEKHGIKDATEDEPV
jgi:hypothetical protein